MERTDEVRKLMAYATEHRPAVVILENAADLQNNSGMRKCGEAIEAHLRNALPDYEWRAQVVDSYTHMGLPMKRERGFWVGTRPVQ